MLGANSHSNLFGRINTGVTNIASTNANSHSSHAINNIMPPGQRFIKKQRPSSAGVTRPQASSSTQQYAVKNITSNADLAQHSNQTNTNATTYTSAPTSSNITRPRSSGGRPSSKQNAPVYVFSNGHSGISAQDYVYAQQHQHHLSDNPTATATARASPSTENTPQTNDTHQPHQPLTSTMHTIHTTPNTTHTTINQQANTATSVPRISSQQRPLSANATSLTSNGKNRYTGNNNEWSSSYKLYYGAPTDAHVITSASPTAQIGQQKSSPGKPSTSTLNNVTYADSSKSSTAVKLRTEVATATTANVRG
jgi:hypothetical protein